MRFGTTLWMVLASSLKKYLRGEYNIKHIHGKPLHPQTQGKDRTLSQVDEECGKTQPLSLSFWTGKSH